MPPLLLMLLLISLLQVLLSLSVSALSSPPHSFSPHHSLPTTALLSAPCRISFRRPRSLSSTFDFLVLSPSQWRLLSLVTPPHKAIPHLPHLSRLSISASHAYHTDSTHIYFRSPPLPPGRYAILIRDPAALHNTAAHQWQIYHIARQNVCPLVLPTTTRLVAKQPTNYIIGGRPIDPALLPYLVYIENGSRSCTGTLINPLWILTAAHCKVGRGDRAHVNASTAASGTIFPVRRGLIHPKYSSSNNGHHYDVALARLEFPVPFIKGMLINSNQSNPIDDSAARVMGYGQTSRTDKRAGRLLMVDVPIVSHPICESRYGPSSLLREVDLCAGYSGCDSCNGDSGGPLIQYTPDNQPVIIAVVSRGRECGLTNDPGVYARIHYFLSWIQGSVPVRTVSNITQLITDEFPDAVPLDRGPSRVAWWLYAAAGVAGFVLVVNVLAMAWRMFRKPASPRPPTLASDYQPGNIPSFSVHPWDPTNAKSGVDSTMGLKPHSDNLVYAAEDGTQMQYRAPGTQPQQGQGGGGTGDVAAVL